MAKCQSVRSLLLYRVELNSIGKGRPPNSFMRQKISRRPVFSELATVWALIGGKGAWKWEKLSSREIQGGPRTGVAETDTEPPSWWLTLDGGRGGGIKASCQNENLQELVRSMCQRNRSKAKRGNKPT